MAVHIIVDGDETNCKVIKDVLKRTNDIDEENKLPDAALKCEPHFMRNDENVSSCVSYLT